MVIRGEILIELDNSWLIMKTIVVVLSIIILQSTVPELPDLEKM